MHSTGTNSNHRGWMLTFAYLIYRKRLISYSTCQTAYYRALATRRHATTCRDLKKGPSVSLNYLPLYPLRGEFLTS